MLSTAPNEMLTKSKSVTDIQQTEAATGNEFGAEFYGDALSRVHDTAFTAMPLAAASTAIDLLPQPSGGSLIVDLGCGSGAASRSFIEAGYKVHGIDISEPMINLARRSVPEASFEVGSIFDAHLPTALGVVAIGEIFNYATANRSPKSLADMFDKITESLEPGGLFLFDVAGPGRSRVTAQTQVHDTDDWTMWFHSEEDLERSLLTRKITTFSRDEANVYSRSDELHLLRLWQDDDIAAQLDRSGLRGTKLPGYRGFPATPGWSMWLARKPA